MSATEREMLDRLNVRYGKWGQNGVRYARGEHVRLTAGHDTRRTADYLAFDLFPGVGRGSGPKLHGHEVKVSRSDWLTELKDPEKAEAFARYCDFFWLVVADPSIVKLEELPHGWGLLTSHGRTLRVVVAAERREDVEPLPRDLQATFARAVMKTTVRLASGEDPAVRFLQRRMGLAP